MTLVVIRSVMEWQPAPECASKLANMFVILLEQKNKRETRKHWLLPSEMSRETNEIDDLIDILRQS